MTTTPAEVLRQARDALAYLLPLAEMQPADIEPGHHLMQGDCPDETQPSSRDKDCPACQRMISAAELIAAIDAMPSTQADCLYIAFSEDGKAIRFWTHDARVAEDWSADNGAAMIAYTATATASVAGLPSGAWQQCHACIDPAGCNLLDRCHAPAPQAVQVQDDEIGDLVTVYGDARVVAAEAGHIMAAVAALQARQRLMDAIAAHATTPAAAAEQMTGVGTPDFEAWWSKHGQFVRAGGGAYEKCFAFSAWCAAKPAPAVAATVPPLTYAEETELLYRKDWRERSLRKLIRETAQVCATAWGVRIAAANEEQK